MAGIRLPEQNHVALVGRLTRDPDLRFTQKGAAMCRFSIAVNRRYKDTATGEWKDDTSFIPVIVWKETAERCGQRLKKGSPVHVEGRLRSRDYEDKQGQKRTGIEVEARRVQFLESMADAKVGAAAGVSGAGSEMAGGSVADAPAEGGGEDGDLEEVPF